MIRLLGFAFSLALLMVWDETASIFGAIGLAQTLTVRKPCVCGYGRRGAAISGLATLSVGEGAGYGIETRHSFRVAVSNLANGSAIRLGQNRIPVGKNSEEFFCLK